MMRWHQFEAAEPQLAAAGVQKLAAPGVVLVGTVRRDGTARISAVEPLLFEGELWLSMGFGSHKVADLHRDPRVVVRSIVTSRDGSDGDYIVRGVAVEEVDAARQQAFADEVAARVGWRPEVGRFHLFRIDVEDVTFIRWDDATNDQFVTRWPDRVDLVRRGTSATSHAPAEPYASGLLAPAPGATR
jgi:Pyridoxamine 5'-phosphate oxidase